MEQKEVDMSGALLKIVEEAVRRAGPALRRTLSPIESERDLDRRTKLLHALLDKIGDNEEHPLTFVLDALGRVIEEYEERVHPIEPSSPHEVLSFLIEQRGLKQKELSNIISQSNLSAVLRGKRGLTPLQIKKLSIRFSVPAELFLPE